MLLNEFVVIALAHLFAVATPGPDFAVVFRHSVAYGRPAGLWTSAGVGLGILLHVSYCVLGVGLLLTASPRLFLFFKAVAGLYLVYLGVRSLRSALSRPALAGEGDTVHDARPVRWLLTGFLTNGLNPKVTLFFLALFTVVLDAGTPWGVQVALGLYLALATFGWFALVTLLLGVDRVRSLLLRAGGWFEGLMGGLLIALGVRLALALPPQL